MRVDHVNMSPVNPPSQQHVVDVADKCVELALRGSVLPVLVEVIRPVSDKEHPALVKPYVSPDNHVGIAQVISLNRVDAANFLSRRRLLCRKADPVLLPSIPSKTDVLNFNVKRGPSLPLPWGTPRLGLPRPGEARHHTSEIGAIKVFLERIDKTTEILMKDEVIAEKALAMRALSHKNTPHVIEIASPAFDPHLGLEPNGVLECPAKTLLELGGRNARGADSLEGVVEEHGDSRLRKNPVQLA